MTRHFPARVIAVQVLPCDRTPLRALQGVRMCLTGGITWQCVLQNCCVREPDADAESGSTCTSGFLWLQAWLGVPVMLRQFFLL